MPIIPLYFKNEATNVYRGNQVTAYQNLLAYWTFEEGEGTSTADVSGNGNNAKFSGNPSFTTPSNGKFGRALDFDHDGDYAYIDHFVGLTTADSFSLSAWVKLDALGTSSEDDSAIFSSGAKDSHTTMLWYDFNGNDRVIPCMHLCRTTISAH